MAKENRERTPEELDQEFLEAVQKVCKKYKRGLQTQLRVVRVEDEPNTK